MGLFGDILKGIGNSITNFNNETAVNKSRYANYSDSRLVDIANNGSFAEKCSACAVLKERHGEERAKRMIRNGY
ncbi:MAG: hypothetical protein II943_09710 [Victivallales bacterium]|nr:hypothetical protein [Victivallales bacterium]